jgi:hypothetical protein
MISLKDAVAQAMRHTPDQRPIAPAMPLGGLKGVVQAYCVALNTGFSVARHNERGHWTVLTINLRGRQCVIKIDKRLPQIQQREQVLAELNEHCRRHGGPHIQPGVHIESPYLPEGPLVVLTVEESRSATRYMQPRLTGQRVRGSGTFFEGPAPEVQP